MKIYMNDNFGFFIYLGGLYELKVIEYFVKCFGGSTCLILKLHYVAAK